MDHAQYTIRAIFWVRSARSTHTATLTGVGLRPCEVRRIFLPRTWVNSAQRYTVWRTHPLVPFVIMSSCQALTGRLRLCERGGFVSWHTIARSAGTTRSSRTSSGATSAHPSERPSCGRARRPKKRALARSRRVTTPARGTPWGRTLGGLAVVLPRGSLYRLGDEPPAAEARYHRAVGPPEDQDLCIGVGVVSGREPQVHLSLHVGTICCARSQRNCHIAISGGLRPPRSGQDRWQGRHLQWVLCFLCTPRARLPVHKKHPAP